MNESELRERLLNLQRELLMRRNSLDKTSKDLDIKIEKLQSDIEYTSGLKEFKLRNKLDKLIKENDRIKKRINAIDTLIIKFRKTNSQEELERLLANVEDLDKYLDNRKISKKGVLGVVAVIASIAIVSSCNASKKNNPVESNNNDSTTEEKRNDTNLQETPERKEDAISLSEMNRVYGKEAVDDVLGVYESVLTKYGQNIDAPTIRVDITDEELARDIIEKHGEEKVNEIIRAYESGLTSLDNLNEQLNNSTENMGAFTDINDKEQLLERVNGVIVPVYDELAPEYGVDEAYAIEMFNHFNCGDVKEPSIESCLDVVRTAEVLFNKEYLYASDMRNKGESLREESNVTIDYGIFLLDGSRAQKLASQISEYRRIIITNPNSKEAEQAAKDFTVLFMNSWYLQGNNGTISMYALEPSGQAVFLDKLFLNTADLVQANISEDHEVTVINPLDGEEITLSYMVEEVNKADCEGELIAENGDIVKGFVNKFSADMHGMLTEAIDRKNSVSNKFTYGLDYK